jgi:hypothetical protein
LKKRLLGSFGSLFILVAGSSYGQRFDSKGREDFFAGFAGDNARLERGMKTCEQALAADPKDASASVWQQWQNCSSADEQTCAAAGPVRRHYDRHGRHHRLGHFY